MKQAKLTFIIPALIPSVRLQRVLGPKVLTLTHTPGSAHQDRMSALQALHGRLQGRIGQIGQRVRARKLEAHVQKLLVVVARRVDEGYEGRHAADALVVERAADHVAVA